MSERTTEILRPTDEQAVRLARTLIRSARHGALAVLDPDGRPSASRVGVASDMDGAPIILVSALAPHTGALRGDRRCSLLLGEPGKGDPLAHPRITLNCEASELDRESDAGRRAARRYLNRHPKAMLYANFADFTYFRLEPGGASLNDGFGRAYALTAADLLCTGPIVETLAEGEQAALDHLNADHRDAIHAYAQAAGAAGTSWTVCGIDPDGLDLASGDRTLRIFFAEALQAVAQLRPTLLAMTHGRNAAPDISQ